MARPIICDPALFGGRPHIEGTAYEISDLQAVWRLPGVGAVQMKQRFPDLTDKELGAAVTWAESSQPKHEFVAEWNGPPARRLSIWGEARNWMFECEDTSGGATPNDVDFWEGSFKRILAYPEVYASRDLVWKDSHTGQVVDIYALTFGEA